MQLLPIQIKDRTVKDEINEVLGVRLGKCKYYFMYKWKDDSFF